MAGTLTPEQLAGWLGKVAANMKAGLVSKLMLAATEVQGAIHEEVKATNWKRSQGGLSRAFVPVPLADKGSTFAVGVFARGAAARYADAQDDEGGTTIYPKTVKNLAIPLTEKARIRWPRQWGSGELFVLKLPGGPPMLVAYKGKEFTQKGKKRYRAIEPQYLLVPSVTVYGKGYLKRAETKAAPVVESIIGDGAIAVFKGET